MPQLRMREEGCRMLFFSEGGARAACPVFGFGGICFAPGL